MQCEDTNLVKDTLKQMYSPFQYHFNFWSSLKMASNRYHFDLNYFIRRKSSTNVYIFVLQNLTKPHQTYFKMTLKKY